MHTFRKNLNDSHYKGETTYWTIFPIPSPTDPAPSPLPLIKQDFMQIASIVILVQRVIHFCKYYVLINMIILTLRKHAYSNI